MPGKEHSGTGIKFGTGDLSTAAAKLRETLARPELQAARSELMANPEGEALLEQAKKLYQGKSAAIKAGYQAAADQLVSLSEENGVPAELAKNLSHILKDAPVSNPQLSYERTMDWIANAKSATGSKDWSDAGSPSGAQDTEVSIIGAIRNYLADNDDTTIQASSDQPDVSSVSGDNTLTEYIKKCDSSSALSAGNITDVDYSIMSELAYARKFCNSEKFRIASEKDGLTVGQYCQELLLADEGMALTRDERQFLEALRDSPRYSSLTIDHADGLDTGNVNTQVLVLNTGDGHAMIAVEGTNGTTTDWINDAKFASADPTEEELYLIQKVKGYLDEYNSFDITGHSQGGRDAVTIAAFLTDEQKEKLGRVYSLDGPGYSPTFIERHGDKLDSIRDKTINIRPENSYVGPIFIPVGKVVYVRTNATGTDVHHGSKWLIATDEYGNPTGYFVEGNETPITGLINDLTVYAAERFSPEVLEETLPTIIRLAANPENPTQLKFELDFVAKNLEDLSISDSLMLVSMVSVLLADATLELIDECGPYLEAAGLILTVLSVIPWPGAAICGTLATIVNNIEDIAAAVEKICKVVTFICEWYLEHKARAMKRERDAYIAGHDEIVMNYEALRAASALLESASLALNKARTAGESMWDHFAQKRVNEQTNIVEEIAQTVWEVVTTVLSPAKALQWAVANVSDALQDLTIMSSRPYCNKGVDTIDRVITAANSIAVSAQVNSTEKTFSVKPADLGSCAAAAQEIAKIISANITVANTAVNDAGSIWDAEDYTSIKTITNKEIEKILEQLDGMKGAYAAVADLATNYSVLQSTAVQEFQYAAN